MVNNAYGEEQGVLGVRHLALLNKALYANGIDSIQLKEEPFGMRPLVEI